MTRKKIDEMKPDVFDKHGRRLLCWMVQKLRNLILVPIFLLAWLPWVNAPHDRRILAYCQGLVYGAPVEWIGIVNWSDGFEKWPETKGWQGIPQDTPGCTHWMEAPKPPQS